MYALQSLHIVLGLQEDLVKAETPDSKDSVAHAQLVSPTDMGNGV